MKRGDLSAQLPKLFLPKMEIMSNNKLSLGAPPPRQPKGGTFLTNGGIQIDAIVRPLLYTHGEVNPCDIDEEDCESYVSEFFSNENGSKEEESEYSWGSDGAIERLIDLLDYRKGALLTSSYEFPGRCVPLFVCIVVEFVCFNYAFVFRICLPCFYCNSLNSFICTPNL